MEKRAWGKLYEPPTGTNNLEQIGFHLSCGLRFQTDWKNERVITTVNETRHLLDVVEKVRDARCNNRTLSRVVSLG